MDDLDQITDRLHLVAGAAPVPPPDPGGDLVRGRAARLRRRRRVGTGLAAAVVLVAAGVANLPESGSGGDSLTVAADPTAAPGGDGGGCATTAVAALAEVRARSARDAVPVVVGYRRAIAEGLDPGGRHVARGDLDRADDVQATYACDKDHGEHLTALGTTVAWNEGAARGAVAVEVSAPGRREEPPVLLDHTGWAVYPGPLPPGVVAARAVEYGGDAPGRAVVATRADGLVVALDASSVWANNAPAGAPAVVDLPSTRALLDLAGSDSFVLPAL